MRPNQSTLATLDTTKASLLHRLFRADPPGKETKLWRSWIRPYIIVVFTLYGLPLLVAWKMLPTLTDTSGQLEVPFLRDWNVIFMYLVTMPLLLVLLLTERNTIPVAIDRVVEKRVLTPPTELVEFCDEWEKRYAFWNILAQGAAVLVGIIAALANYWAEIDLKDRCWQITNGQVNTAGWVYLLWQIPVFYGVLTIYAIRSVTTNRLLAAIVRSSDLNLRLFDTDRAAGLRPIGGIGLRNLILLMAGGFNLLCMLSVAIKLDNNQMRILLAGAAVVYILICPIVFVGPLLPFWRGMLRARRRYQEKIAGSLFKHFTTMMSNLDDASLSEQDEKNLDRLLAMKKIADKIPILPFDTAMTMKALFVFGSPLAIAGFFSLAQVVKNLIEEYYGASSGS